MKISGNHQTRTIQGVRDTLNQAFEAAVNMELVLRNPVRGVKMPKEERNPEAENAKAIPIDMRRRILDAVADNPILKPILLTFLFTGVRPAELLALTWDKVNLLSRTITILSAVVRKPEFDVSGNKTGHKYVVSTPKTRASVRVIKAPAIVIEALSEWKKYIDEACPDHSDFVFCTRDGRMRTYSSLRSAFRRFLVKHGLDSERLYMVRFRHTFATMLLENGVNPRVVQRIMGHSDIGMTLGTYSHVVPEIFNEVADVLGGIYIDTVAGTYTPRMTGDKVVRLMREVGLENEREAV
jgi:integrase